MNCKELIEFLDRYVALELSPDVRGRFDQHLELCPPCRDYLDSYEKTVLLGRRAFDCEGDAPPEELPRDLVQAILSALRRGSDGGGGSA